MDLDIQIHCLNSAAQTQAPSAIWVELGYPVWPWAAAPGAHRSLFVTVLYLPAVMDVLAITNPHVGNKTEP